MTLSIFEPFYYYEDKNNINNIHATMHEPLDIDKIPLQEQKGYPKVRRQKGMSDSNIRADMGHSFLWRKT
jgi:hypothetical protein